MYEAPKVIRVGSFAELTQSTIYKNAGSGDVIVIGGESISVPGGTVTHVS